MPNQIHLPFCRHLTGDAFSFKRPSWPGLWGSARDTRQTPKLHSVAQPGSWAGCLSARDDCRLVAKRAATAAPGFIPHRPKLPNSLEGCISSESSQVIEAVAAETVA